MEERLLEVIRRCCAGSQKAFAAALGVSTGNVADWLRGRSRPSERNRSAICARFGINPVWLSHGQGQIMVAEAGTALDRRLRLDAVRMHFRCNPGQFARLLGLPRDYIAASLGQSADEPRADVMARVAERLGVDPRWLVSGPGTGLAVIADRKKEKAAVSALKEIPAYPLTEGERATGRDLRKAHRIERAIAAVTGTSTTQGTLEHMRWAEAVLNAQHGPTEGGSDLSPGTQIPSPIQTMRSPYREAFESLCRVVSELKSEVDNLKQAASAPQGGPPSAAPRASCAILPVLIVVEP